MTGADPPSGPTPTSIGTTTSLSITASKLLLVEGMEESRFWRRFLELRGKEGFQVVPYNGKNNLSNAARAFSATPGFGKVTWLGIMRDADSDPKGAFQSVASALHGAYLPIPTSAWEPTAGPRVVTAFILPDGTSLGALEDLILGALARDPAIPGVVSSFQSLGRVSLSPTGPSSKARLHAYLASRPRGELRLAEATEAGHLTTAVRDTAFDRLIGHLP